VTLAMVLLRMMSSVESGRFGAAAVSAAAPILQDLSSKSFSRKSFL
jgi:hypothetical protein